MATRKKPSEKNESSPLVTLTPELEKLIEMLPQLQRLAEYVFELEELSCMSRDIDDVVDWWLHRDERGKESTRKEISIGLFTGPDERKTVRVYPEVWARWKQFCGMFPSYNEKDLMGTALFEFMDRYSPAKGLSIEDQFIDTVTRAGISAEGNVKEVLISEIIIEDRVRNNYGSLDSLERSIQLVGVLQPIGITPDKRLLFGERRLRASKNIGLTTIPVRIFDIDADNPIEALRMEREENEHRMDLTPSEKVEIAMLIEKAVEQSE